ncbi:MAG: hypothetical protein WA957_00365, partial [Alteraurantiacibacter sp.]
EEAAIAEHMERLDVNQRIFPTLPLKPEEQIAAEEEAERLAAEQAVALDEDGKQNAEPAAGIDISDKDAPSSESTKSHAPEIDLAQNPADEHTDAISFGQYLDDADLPSIIAEENVSQTASALPVNPLPEPEAEMVSPPPPMDQPRQDLPFEEDTEQAPEPIASAQDVFGAQPFLEFPAHHLVWTPVSETTQEIEAASDQSETEPYDAPYDAEPEETFEETSTRFEWAYEDDKPEEDSAEGLDATAPHEVVEEDADPVHDGSYTEVEDEQVDGYAFMYAQNPRGRTIHALAGGESNSLRAKLIKERAEAQRDAEVESTPTMWGRFSAWLRGLLG